MTHVFSPNPAVSSVADKQVLHPEIYILCSIVLYFIQESVISFSHLCVHMGQMDFISSIFVRFFYKIIWEYSLITRCIFIGWSVPLFEHSTLLRKQWRLAQISVYIHVPFDHVTLSNSIFWDKQCIQ